jgi:hypothetical protein
VEFALLLMPIINLVEEDWLNIPMHPQVTQSISFFFFLLIFSSFSCCSKLIFLSQILFSLSLIGPSFAVASSSSSVSLEVSSFDGNNFDYQLHSLLFGVCTAYYADKSVNADGTRRVCGEDLLDHPHAPGQNI